MAKLAQKLRLIRLVIVTVLLVATTNSACGPDEPDTFFYAVRVRAQDTGEGIPNAQVRVVIADGRAPLGDFTDAEGFARICVDASYVGQPAELIVEALGYERYDLKIDLIEGRLPTVIQLERENPIPSIEATDTPSVPTTATSPATPVASPTESPPPTSIVSPTEASPSTPTVSLTEASPSTPTVSPTEASPSTPTVSPTETSPPTMAPTSASPSLATAIQGASIFAAPASNSQVLGGISVGEQVPVLGRSAAGQWFYVRDDQGIEGFVYAPWFDWSGDLESLPVKESTVTTPPSTATPTTTTPPPPLEIDLWDIAGTERCSETMWYKSVFIRGRGGNGVYTYYWNGVKLAGPMSESYTFEMHTTGGAMVGTGKVVSGDGQEVKKGLQITVPTCAE